MKGFLTAREAAEKLGVSTDTVRQMITDGELKAEQVGDDSLIAESEIARAGAEKPEKSTPPPINELANLKISIEQMESGYLREVAVTQYDSKIKQLADMQPGVERPEIDRLVAEEVEKIRQSNQKT